MTPSEDLARTIRTVLTSGRACPTRSTGRCCTPAPDRNDPPSDPDWAIREIVDGVMFETAHP